MKSIRKFLYRWLLPKCIERSCGSRIRRSGDEGKKINCFEVALYNEKTPFFLATGIQDETVIQGLKWDGNTYSEEHSIHIDDIDSFKVVIKHYYGLSEIRFYNIYYFTWNYVSKTIYLKIHIIRTFSYIGQYLFNRKKLVTKNRMELLHFMLEDQITRTHDSIGIISLMTKLYSIKWVLHPSSSDQQKKLEIYLDSLVESGELNKVTYKYVVTGKALSTLERYEEEERRHIEIVKLHRRMVLLTIILVIVGLLQAGLIKLPTIFDLSINEEHNKSLNKDTR